MRTKNEYKNDDFYKREVRCNEDITKQHEKLESSVHKLFSHIRSIFIVTQI